MRTADRLWHVCTVLQRGSGICHDLCLLVWKGKDLLLMTGCTRIASQSHTCMLVLMRA